MGNSKNNKVPKKRASDTSKRGTSSDQKENVPKPEKARKKPDPDDAIAMSKQLLMKKKNLRTQRRSSSKPDRICANGKPLPSLSELEKLYEDSDDDDQTTTKKSPCATSTPENGSPTSTSQQHLLSPTKIYKITERLLGSIQKQNLPDPSEVMEATSLLREKSPPLLPIIPPKKRKKTEIPYIVGCKDRPQVIRKPNTNFCKGDDYGIEASSEDPEEPKAAKRAKKSRIPNYSKSIFNAQSDEIAERLTKDDVENLSDASGDSNKTIEYELTPIQNQRPQSFSPLPSTSKDNETFKKNDDLFNESLKATQVTKDTTKENDELIDENSKEFNITKEITTKETDNQLTNPSTPIKREDDVSLCKKSSPIKKTDEEVQIIDISYDTIVIDEICEKDKTNIRSPIDTSVIEIIEPAGLDIAKSKNKTEIIKLSNDEDCMIVPNSSTPNNYNFNEPIVIDDEYSTINTEFNSFNKEPIEIIDVDDIIAENRSIFDKWKNNQDQNKIQDKRIVGDVPTTCRKPTGVWATVTPSTTVQTTSTQWTQLQASVSPTTTLQASVSPANSLQAGLTGGSALQAGLMRGTILQASTILNPTVQASVTPSTILQASLTPGTTMQASVTPSTTMQNSQTPSSTLQANLATDTAVPSSSNQHKCTNMTQRFQNILDDFLSARLISPESSSSRGCTYVGNEAAVLIKAIASSIAFSGSNHIGVTTNNQKRSKKKQCDYADLNKPSNNSGTTITKVPPVSPGPQRNIGDCPICLDPLSSSNGIASTICGHVFCLQCIQASIKSNGKKCPTCRKGLKGAGYHQLYL